MRTLLSLTTLALAAAFAVPATGRAERAPTHAEQTQIRALVHKRLGPTVKVSHLHVTSVGRQRWALSTVTAMGSGSPDSASVIYEKRAGAWIITRSSPGTSGYQCDIGLPTSVRKDLHISACK